MFNRNKKLLGIKNNSHLRIGRSESLAHYFEETLAKEFVKKFRDYDVFVDYPLAPLIKGEKIKGCNVYPDILLVKNGNIDYFIELKLTIDYVNLNSLSARENKISLTDGFEYNEYSGIYLTKEEKQKYNPKRIRLTTKNMKKFLLVVMKSTRKEQGELKDKKFAQKMHSFGYKTIFFNIGSYYNARIDKKEIRDKVQARSDELTTIFRGLK